MDEVDAALDNSKLFNFCTASSTVCIRFTWFVLPKFCACLVNLRKVCNYISQRSKTDFQCIVISLKDMFYERSESLVGVCRDVGTSSSRTLTLDLTAFDKKTKAKVTPEKSPKQGSKRKSKSRVEHDDDTMETPSPKKRGGKRKSKANDNDNYDEEDDVFESPAPKRSSRGRRSNTVATPGSEASSEF